MGQWGRSRQLSAKSSWVDAVAVVDVRNWEMGTIRWRDIYGRTHLTCANGDKHGGMDTKAFFCAQMGDDDWVYLSHARRVVLSQSVDNNDNRRQTDR